MPLVCDRRWPWPTGQRQPLPWMPATLRRRPTGRSWRRSSPTRSARRLRRGSPEATRGRRWAGLARTIAGRALARLGQRDRAVQELERAAAELDRCGAVRYRDAAQRELRQLGQHIHRRTRPGDAETGVGSLTERELEIARLIVDRKTNGEIAGELFLSKK